MWSYSTHSNEIWFDTCSSKNWRFVHVLFLVNQIINGLVDIPSSYVYFTSGIFFVFLIFFGWRYGLHKSSYMIHRFFSPPGNASDSVIIAFLKTIISR